MERLAGVDGLFVRQKKEWGEILSGFETKNKYEVTDGTGRQLFWAAEEGGSWFLRILLRAFRPFTVAVMNPEGQVVVRVNRPFRFYFHQAQILDAQGQLLGTIEKKFSLLRRIYSVTDPSGEEICQLFGPMLHPWTFQLKKGGVEFGKITKKWSGFLKEGFTDADNFGVSFPAGWDVRLKSVFLGAVFLIDFVHFENKGRN